MGMRADMRVAAVALLNSYEAANAGSLKQIYAGRPMSIFPPTAFIDGIDEPDINYAGLAGVQRTPRVSIRFVGGVYDSADTAAGQDDLVDGFIAHVIANRHQAGANTLSVIVGVNDEPDWQPEWLEGAQNIYYSTVVILEGLALEPGLI